MAVVDGEKVKKFTKWKFEEWIKLCSGKKYITIFIVHKTFPLLIKEVVWMFELFAENRIFSTIINNQM